MRQNGFWRVGLLMVGALSMSPVIHAEDHVPSAPEDQSEDQDDAPAKASVVDFAELRVALIKARAAAQEPRLHTPSTLMQTAQQMPLNLLKLELPHLGLEASPRAPQSAAFLGLQLAEEWKKEIGERPEFRSFLQRLEQAMSYWQKELADEKKIQELFVRTLQEGKLYLQSELKFRELKSGVSHLLVDADLELGQISADISFLQMRVPREQRSTLHDIFTVARLRTSAMRRFSLRHGCEAHLQK